MARDTKLGQEEITRDIPNVGEEALRNLDEAGIVYIGAEVQPGDILVGKVTPKGESPMTPEEKLLRAIFGEKASDVRDTSLRAAAGRAGHDRRGARLLPPRRRQGRARAGDRAPGDRAPRQGPRRREGDPGAQLLQPPEGAAAQPDRPSAAPRASRPAPRSPTKVLTEFTPGQWRQIAVKDDKRQAELEELRRRPSTRRSGDLTKRFENKVEKLQRGDELPPGVMKMVKVFVAVKRKLQPGDKMAGRHGNKGVISASCRSRTCRTSRTARRSTSCSTRSACRVRMNVGQILETHLGWACARSRHADRRAGRARCRRSRRSVERAAHASCKDIYGEDDYDERRSRDARRRAARRAGART